MRNFSVYYAKIFVREFKPSVTLKILYFTLGNPVRVLRYPSAYFRSPQSYYNMFLRFSNLILRMQDSYTLVHIVNTFRLTFYSRSLYFSGIYCSSPSNPCKPTRWPNQFRNVYQPDQTVYILAHRIFRSDPSFSFPSRIRFANEDPYHHAIIRKCSLYYFIHEYHNKFYEYAKVIFFLFWDASAPFPILTDT